jgi:hypothetical protein
VQSTTQKHIDNVIDNAAATLNRPNMTYIENAAVNRSTCSGFVGGSGLDNAAGVGCHNDRGAWKRLWSTEADNTATTLGSPRCNVCHGQWSTIAGSAGWRDNTSHFNADSASTGTHGKTHDSSPEVCTQCHPYSVPNHQNKLITMNDNSTRVSDNTTSRRAGCSQCHNGVDYVNGKSPDTAHSFPMSVFPMQKVVGAQVNAACTGCHGGTNGDVGQVQNNAPNITTYWMISGHGRYSTSSPQPVAAITCDDCHDTGYLTGADHKANGTATGTYPPTNTNTLMWPGKTGNADTSPNANTAHLVSSFFPGSATTKLAYAQAFDTKCGSRSTGCHTRATPPSHVGKVHPDSTVAPYDNVLIFGRSHGGTTPVPKAYSWYPVISSASDYAARFYEAPAVWLIQDITTNSNSGSFPDNATNYGTCVTCHDPHGTNAPINYPGATTNFMLRGDAYTAPSFFCNTVCHGT